MLTAYIPKALLFKITYVLIKASNYGQSKSKLANFINKLIIKKSAFRIPIDCAKFQKYEQDNVVEQCANPAAVSCNENRF